MEDSNFFFSYSSSQNSSSETILFKTKGGETKCYRVTESFLEIPDPITDNFSITSLKEFLNRDQAVPVCVIWYNWDSQNITIARDAFGQIPVYYSYIPEKELRFSTTINTLSAFREKTDSSLPSINLKPLENYFEFAGQSIAYSPSTFFSSIHTILPGHFVIFDKNSQKSISYLNYNPEKYSHLKTLSAFGTIFKELFFKRIKALVANQKIIGMHLSGGLDSSSVAVSAHFLAASTTKHSFCYDVPSSSIEDIPLSKEVAEVIDSQHHFITPDYCYVNQLYNFLKAHGQPIYSIGATGLTEKSFALANQLNCSILLTGHDGDSIVGKGRNFFRSLVKDKNWQALDNEITAFCESDCYIDYHPESAAKTIDSRKEALLRNILLKEVKRAIKSGGFKFFKVIRNALKHFNISPFYFIKELAISLANRRTSRSVSFSVLRKNFLNQNFATLDGPSSTFSDTLEGDNLKHHLNILFNPFVKVNEEFYSKSGLFDINLQHPFLDKELYELCLAVPPKFLFNHGYSRGPLREAMKDLLPEKVKSRITKANFSKYTKESTLSLHFESQEFLVPSSPVWDFVKNAKYHDFIKVLQHSENEIPDLRYTFFILRTICLAVWLHIYKNNDFVVPVYENRIDLNTDIV